MSFRRLQSLPYRTSTPRGRLSPLVLTAAVGFSFIGLHAQYPGHSEKQGKQGPVLRAVAVLEWTGEAGKPSASRLIPVSVFHDGTYEDGGLYLARPEPLPLESGLEYQLQEAGLPQSRFDIASAAQLNGSWFGYGSWKPLAAPAPIHHLNPSKIDPQVVDGGDDRRPHFRKATPESASGVPGAANPPEDPDRPTLRKRDGGAPDASATANPVTADATGSRETATAGVDPDRPKLGHGRHSDEAKEPERLEGTPANLEQMVAVSDATDRTAHSFRYSFADPQDANKLKAQLTTIAEQAVAKAAAAKPTAAAPAAARSGTHPATTTRSSTGATQTTTAAASSKTTGLTPAQIAARRRAQAAAARRKAAAHSAGVVLLTDVEFRAFELTYSGGATLVLTARTAGDEAKTTYVTIIAQPDIYGTPQVLFTHITKADDLDAQPRMRLIDAVDAAADNRGDLLFELRGATTRQFALYRAASGRVDQLIATVPLPIGAAAAH